jgi:hypothetical protein
MVLKIVLSILTGLASLSCEALSSVQLSWVGGEPPFTVEATRLYKCKEVTIFKFNTYNNKEVIKINGTYCTTYKLSTKDYKLELPRQKVTKNQMVLCK